MAAKTIKFNKTESALRTWGFDFIDTLRAQMKIDKTHASGDTGRSIESKVTGTRLEILARSRDDVSILEAIDKGTKGYKKPPSSKNIVEWMKSKGIRPRRNGKIVKSAESNYNRAATAIAMAIMKNGTIKRYGGKGSGVLDFTFNRMEGEFESQVLGAYLMDLEDFINNNTKRVVK